MYVCFCKTHTFLPPLFFLNCITIGLHIHQTTKLSTCSKYNVISTIAGYALKSQILTLEHIQMPEFLKLQHSLVIFPSLVNHFVKLCASCVIAPSRELLLLFTLGGRHLVGLVFYRCIKYVPLVHLVSCLAVVHSFGIPLYLLSGVVAASETFPRTFKLITRLVVTFLDSSSVCVC